MAKLTPIQRYYLCLIAYMRWLGAIVAALAVMITATNLPRLLRSHDVKIPAVNVAGGAGFLLVGLALYRVCADVQHRYRAHILQQID